MPDDVRLGFDPEPEPRLRSARILVAAALLVLLAAAGAWLAGIFSGDTTTTTTGVDITFVTTTAATSTTVTVPVADLLAAAPAFWTALGSGDAAAAAAGLPAPAPAAVDLMGFVAAFRPGFTAVDCTPFAADAVQCTVTVTAEQLVGIGTGTPEERLVVAGDGWFGVPALLGSAAARLSLYALDVHTEEVRAACPVTDNPQAPRLAIVGSATAECGAYLAGLIPDYLGSLHLRGGFRE